MPCQKTTLQIIIKGFENPAIQFKSRQENYSEKLQHARHDFKIQNKNNTTLIELTCPFEINLIKSNHYKQKCYENLQIEFLTPTPHLSILFLEISSRSFADHETNKIIELLKKYAWMENKLLQNVKRLPLELYTIFTVIETRHGNYMN